MIDEALWCVETSVHIEQAGQENEKGAILGIGEPYQTAYAKVGDLYRACLKQHGRCLGYMMVDVDNISHRVGWTFRRRPTVEEMYGHSYGREKQRVPPHTLLETWVEVFRSPPKQVWVPGVHAKVG